MFAIKWTNDFLEQVEAEEVEMDVAIDTGVARGKDVGDTLRKLFLSLGIESGCNAVKLSPFLRSVYPMFNNKFGVLETIQIFAFAAMTTTEGESPGSGHSSAVSVSALSCEMTEPLERVLALTLSIEGLKRALAVLSVALPGGGRNVGGGSSGGGRGVAGDCATVRALHRMLKARSDVAAASAVVSGISTAASASKDSEHRRDDSTTQPIQSTKEGEGKVGSFTKILRITEVA